MVHLHEVRDSDKHFVIDPVTMVITNNSEKTTIRQGDHNSEIYTFEIPKIVEGHDMSQCNRVEIHYNNDAANKAESSEDFYLVTDMHIDHAETDTLCFSWLIHGNATKFDGMLSFRIRFGCVDDEGKYTYKKHTETYDGITVSPGKDNTAADIEEYGDVVYGLIADVKQTKETTLSEVQQMKSTLNGLIANVQQTKNTLLGEVQQMKETLLDGFSSTKIAEITLQEATWAALTHNDKPMDVYSQEVYVEGLTASSKVDLLPDPLQLEIFRNKELAFVTANIDGALMVFAIGEKPDEDYTMQVAITEVKL